MQRLKFLQREIRRFVADREWEQFHSPKNLAMAMSVESAEVVEIFQWLTEAQSARLPPKRLQHLKDELADVYVYLLRLASKYDIDLIEAACAKMKKNARKYPVSKAKGSMRKYTEL